MNGSYILKLQDAASVPGDQGEDYQFINVDLTVEGVLKDIVVEFGGPVEVEAIPEPYIVPGPIGVGSGEEHPLWNGGIERDIPHGFEVIDLGAELVDGTYHRIYSVRIHPVDMFTSGSCIIYQDIILKYSCSEYEAPVEYPTVPSSGKTLGNTSYLIITHKDLAASLDHLVKWKSQKGVFTELVTTETISSMYKGKDLQAEIRSYIQDMEAVHDLDYVLLVGDVNMVKTRNSVNLYPYIPNGEPSTFASDSYFACVDAGTSWNKDGDSSYCEIGELDDAIPDLALGRIASNDNVLISDLVEHLIERERNITWDDRMGSAIFIAGDPDTVPGYPPDTLDHFWDTYGKQVFSGRETIYYDGSGTLPFSSTSFGETIGNKHQAACYYSHGMQTGLPGLFSNNQVQSLSDQGPEGSFFTMACLTGYFDSSSTECFAEAMTETKDKGVLGYIGSSRLAVGEIDTTYSGDAPGLEEDYWRAVRLAAEGDLRPTVGDIYRKAVTHFSSTFYPFPTDYYGYSSQRTFLEYNLFGEPEAPLFFHPPERLELEFELVDDNRTLTAKVTNSSGMAVENATVTLYRYLELGVSGTTNSSGEVRINIPNSNGGVVNITASRLGDLPVNYTFVLEDDLAPTPLYDLDPDTPDGFGGTYITRPLIRLFGDEEVTVEYRIDDGDLQVFPDEVTFSGDEGYHEIEFRVIDLTGHTSQWTVFNFTLDQTPPELWITTDPASPDGLDGWFISPVKVMVNGSEELAISYYRVDDSVEQLYEGPFSLYNGIHEIKMRSYDLAGNINYTESIIKIDTTSPYSTLEISHSPDGKNGYYVSLPVIFIKAYDENVGTPQYRWDNGSWQNYTSPIYPLKGIHRLDYRAVDSTGNVEEKTNFKWFRYDPDPPEMYYNITPKLPDGDNDIYVSKPIVELFVDPVEINPVYIRYYLGASDQGLSWIENSLPYIGPILVPEGEWSLYMMAEDEAGNQRSLTPLEFTVDTTRPEFTWNITPSEPDGDNMWYVSAPILSVSKITKDALVHLIIDDNDTMMEFDGNLSLPPGEHTIVLEVSDIAGNTALSSPFSYRFDDLDPVAVINLDRVTFFVDEIINLSAGASSDENKPLMYMFSNSDGGSSLWVDESSWTFRFNTTGNHSVNVTVKDRAGRTSRSRDVEVHIIERPLPPRYDDLAIQPFDPGPFDDDGWIDARSEQKLFFRGGLFLLCTLIITLILVLLIRWKGVQDFEWEDDDDWLNEDWVDIDIDEEPESWSDDFFFE
ncbi:MAG: C25 family cysteine peptidase [Thermoplasmatota archaeon]